MDYKTLYAKTPPTRLFFKAAVPGSIGMLASSIFQLVDGMLVGQLLGNTAFAALNLAMPFVIINFALADLIGVGSSVSISIRLGEKNEKEASNLFTCASLMILGAAVLIGSVLFFAAPFLMRLMGADAELAALAVQYLRVYAVFSPLTTILFAVDNYLRICGKIRTSMALNIFMAGMCALLEFLFLYVFRFGIWGAALGTCISMSLSTLIAFYPFFRGRLALKFCRPRFSARSIRKTLSCGCPVFLNNVAGRVASILMNTILLRLGGDSAVSVYGILMYVDGFIQPLLYGMCDSLQPAVGFNWGAKDYRRVTAIEKRCFTASGILSLVFSAVIFFFPAQIAGLFTQGGEAGLLEMAIPAVTLFSATYVTRWISFASQSFMSAIEKPLLASIISVMTVLGFPVVLILIFWPLGLTGLWLNLPGTALLSAVLSVVILLGIRKQLRGTEE